VRLLQNFIRIDVEDIPSFMTVKDFTIELIDIAGKDILSITHNVPQKQTAAPETIKFGNSVENNMATDPKEIFMSNEPRIYATFKTDQFTDDAVLAKWYRTDTKEVCLFDKFPIDPNKENNYVWFEPKSQSDPGSYAVEIYSLNDGLEVIATGRYSVVDSTPTLIEFTGKFL